MTDMKAIETRYNGYRFRSRLEARWAVFFDKMGIEYLYEHEGYEMDGIRYLPDFFFPKYEIHGEVKGVTNGTRISDNDKFKMSCAIDGPCKNGIVILGEIPQPTKRPSMRWFVWREHEVGYIKRPVPDAKWFEHYRDSDHMFFDNVECCDVPKSYITYAEDDFGQDGAMVRTALIAARSARFEHGEGATA